MNELTILDWSKPERKVSFVGYNSARTICYIYNEERARRAIDLWLPSGYGLKFAENPVPPTPPDEICRSVLSLPSFGPFISKSDVALYVLLKSQDKSAPAKDPIPLVSLHPRKQWDAPDLNKKLLKALADELQRRRRDRAAIELQISGLPDDKAESARVHCLPDPKEIASDEATTLEELQQDKFGLRAKVLQTEFIKHHRLDPGQITLNFAQFCRWIRVEGNPLPDQTLTRLTDRIRYTIHFTNNTGCWLEGVDERALTDPQEVEDFDRLEESAEITGEARLPLEIVLGKLGSERKGRHKPMGIRGFKKLCQREKLNYEQFRKRGMQPSLLDKLLKKRQRQKQSRVARLERINAQDSR